MSTVNPTAPPPDPYPPGTITLFDGQGTPIQLTGVTPGSIDWSSYPACPNLVQFKIGGVNYYTTLPFLYHE